MQITDKEAEAAIRMQEDIFTYIENMWGLIPQPIKIEHEAFVHLCINTGEYNKVLKEHFERFIKGEHVTWQQFLILSAYQRATKKKDKKEIAIASGHGIGKSAALVWIIFHFLFAYEDSNIACTAPSKDQMFDVLWKEASKWHTRMKLPNIKSWYVITSDKISIRGREKQWWAKAKTASKDNTEALSGVHADDVLLLVDEASGVVDEVYENGIGSLTNDNYVFMMISNPTKDSGKFHRAFNKEGEKDIYQHLAFSSEDSPVVEPGFINKILALAGNDKDDDIYRVRVRGLFPRKGSIESKNYYQLVKESYLNIVQDDKFYEWDLEKTTLGIDPAGKGQDETVWVLRDNDRAKIIGWEKISNEFSIARQTWVFLQFYNIIGCPIIIDNFGEGANVGLEIANMSDIPNFSQFVYPINVGKPAKNHKTAEKYLNLKAYYYDVCNSWLMKGGELVKDHRWQDELAALKFTYDEKGKIKMMSKQLLVSQKINSPSCWEALILTFNQFDLRLLSSNLTPDRNKIKRNFLPKGHKKGKINSEDDYLSDHL